MTGSAQPLVPYLCGLSSPGRSDDPETEKRRKGTQQVRGTVTVPRLRVPGLQLKTQNYSSLGTDWKDIGLNPPTVAFEGIWSNSRLPDSLLRTGRSGSGKRGDTRGTLIQTVL